MHSHAFAHGNRDSMLLRDSKRLKHNILLKTSP
jgi:hypothetical protein